MKKIMVTWLAMIMLSVITVGCASSDPGRYNTQRGAVIGGAIGAGMGQAIGQNTRSTLIGAAVGTGMGALIGNAEDQRAQAEREAYAGRAVHYQNEQGGTTELIPITNDQRTECRKVVRREWKDGKMVSETVEEICEGRKVTDSY